MITYIGFGSLRCIRWTAEFKGGYLTKSYGEYNNGETLLHNFTKMFVKRMRKKRKA